MVFSVAWKAIEEELHKRADKKAAAAAGAGAAGAKGAKTVAAKGKAVAGKKAGSMSLALLQPFGLAGSSLTTV